MLTYLVLGIFLTSFFFIIWEKFDKSLVALSGALLMVAFGALTPEEALGAVQMDTILLLIAMMLLVSIAAQSGIFEWASVKIASMTKGNPFAIFLFFSLLTMGCSSVLPNVTTIVIIVPITIELLKGMGKDPKPYIFAEIIFSNMGGALTLIGDASNMIIGSATGFSFTQFVSNLWIPITMSFLFSVLIFNLYYWKNLKPISGDLPELFIANVTLRKLKQNFEKREIKPVFVTQVLIILALTLFGLIFQGQIGLPTYIIALTLAVILAVMTAKNFDLHKSFESMEWTTMFFFAGLFVMVAGVEKTGILEQLSLYIVNSADDLFLLTLMVLWGASTVSMLIDNIPFVTVMIPIIEGIQDKLAMGDESNILWWAMCLGACMGGSGTLVGGSANVVAAGVARKNGYKIGFVEYLKFALPLTYGLMVVCSVYFYFVIKF